MPVNGDFAASSASSVGSKVLTLAAAVTRPDPADIDEAVAAMDANQERPEFAVRRGVAADHHLMAGAALGLRPRVRPAGDVGRIALASTRSLRATAGRPSAAPPRRRSRNARRSGDGRRPRHRDSKLLQSLLALRQRKSPQILAACEQQIEGEIDERIGLALGKSRLQRREIRRAVFVERAYLAIDDRIRQLAGGSRDGRDISRSNRGPCGSSKSPRRPARASGCDSRRT